MKRGIQENKTFRIYLLHKFIFESVSIIFGNNNSKYLLLGTFSIKQIEELPKYHKNHLIEYMLDLIKKDNIRFSEESILKNKRITSMKSFMKAKGVEWNKARVLINFRIKHDYINYIVEQSEDVYGEVLELAICYFIIKISEFEFELINTMFKSLIEKESIHIHKTSL